MSKWRIGIVIALGVIILGVAVVQPQVAGAQTLSDWWHSFTTNPTPASQTAQASNGKGTSSFLDLPAFPTQTSSRIDSRFSAPPVYQFDREALFERTHTSKTYYADDGTAIKIPSLDADDSDRDARSFVNACPRDLKFCPDGSTVGRTGTNCAFASCPSDTDVYTGTVVACTKDAKICPDGSAVGRVGPNCEFAACPATSTSARPSTYTPQHTPFYRVTPYQGLRGGSTPSFPFFSN